MSKVHGGGASVIGLACDGQLGPRDPLNAGHRSDGHALGLQHRALLDVEFHERPGGRAGTRRGAPVADAVQFGTQHGAIDAHDV